MFLTTEAGDSVGARVVIDLDTLTVTIRDAPVGRFPLSEVEAERAGGEVLDLRAGEERFRVATPRVEQLAKLLPSTRPDPQPEQEDVGPRGPEWLYRVAAEARRPPPTVLAWAIAGVVALATVLTVWSMVAL